MFSTSDEAFLDQLQRDGLRYFLDHADPVTGLVADRARADGRSCTNVASIAATGFGLTGLCIGRQRGWIDPMDAQQRIGRTLRFVHDHLEHQHGFHAHFVDMRTGQRSWNCEFSSIDTALLLAGVLTARQCLRDDEQVATLATGIFNRVDWRWMLGRGDHRTLSMGWKPRRGFLRHRWDAYCELLILYLLALGSATHPLDTDSWLAWRRGPLVGYGDRRFLGEAPLFVHQFSHAWIDFCDQRDGEIDYWDNSIVATMAHRQRCIDLASDCPERCGHFGELLWGVTSSDSPKGYRPWGTFGPRSSDEFDGTVVHCAAGGSLPFAPQPCVQALRFMQLAFPQTYQAYGFVDAFHPATGWINPDVIGIDVGITLLMAENARTGQVWDWFMASDEIQQGFRRAGFTRDQAGQRLRKSA